jgi:hypothetical protein
MISGLSSRHSVGGIGSSLRMVAKGIGVSTASVVRVISSLSNSELIAALLEVAEASSPS